MKKTQQWLTLALVIILAFSMAACSAKSDSYTSSPNTAPTTDELYYSRGDSYDYDYETAEAPEAVQEYAGGVVSSPLTVAQEDVALTDDGIFSEKIIYSGSAEVETLEFEESISKLNALLEKYKGFIQSSNVTGNDYYSSTYGTGANRSAYYELRIPSSSFANLTGELETLGSVPYCSTNAENVSAQYQDTAARLVALRAQEERYLELLQMATTIEEVLYVESYLTDVRYQIENLESNLRNWDSRVSYSTLSLNIFEVRDYTDEPVIIEEITYGEQLKEAFNDSMTSLVNFFKWLLAFLISAIPAIVILAIIAIPVIVIIIRRNRKLKKSISENAADKMTEE